MPINLRCAAPLLRLLLLCAPPCAKNSSSVYKLASTENSLHTRACGIATTCVSRTRRARRIKTPEYDGSSQKQHVRTRTDGRISRTRAARVRSVRACVIYRAAHRAPCVPRVLERVHDTPNIMCALYTYICNLLFVQASVRHAAVEHIHMRTCGSFSRLVQSRPNISVADSTNIDRKKSPSGAANSEKVAIQSLRATRKTVIVCFMHRCCGIVVCTLSSFLSAVDVVRYGAHPPLAPPRT